MFNEGREATLCDNFFGEVRSIRMSQKKVVVLADKGYTCKNNSGHFENLKLVDGRMSRGLVWR